MPRVRGQNSPSSPSTLRQFPGNCSRASSSDTNGALLLERLLRGPDAFAKHPGGTLFLDEIGDMAVDLQAKLLRVLQSGEVTAVGGRAGELVDVRIIAATHRDLDAGVRDGTFREDLLYRLRVVPMSLAPLRERIEDVRSLARHFVERYAPELAEGPITLPDATIERLETHDWPGNVRELEKRHQAGARVVDE